MKYLHHDNKDKEFVDWRDPSRRMDGFLRWIQWRMRWCDLDHYVCNNAYRDAFGDQSPTGQPMTTEQVYWFCLIFGMTYQSEMAWVIYSQFPDFWDIDTSELQRWNVESLKRQWYAKDTKYNKGRIQSQVESLQKIIGPSGSIEKYFTNLVDDNPHSSYERVYNACNTFHKYGRMTSWLVCQTLFESANLQIKPDTMLATDPSNWSVRSGLMYLYNRDDKIEAVAGKVRFSEDDLKWIEKKEKELFQISLEYINEKDRIIFSNYLLESHLCQYKKLMLGGDYAGHSSGDHVSRASWLRDNWSEVNFDAFFQGAVQRHCPLVRNKMESRELRFLCSKTGQLVNMHNDFDDLPDIYKEVGLDPQWFYNKNQDSVVGTLINNYSSRLFNNQSSLDDFALLQ